MYKEYCGCGRQPRSEKDMCEKITDSRLSEIFAEEGRQHGYNTITAGFMAFKEFKIRWQRTSSWADFKVSDYLEDAPEQVVRDLAHTLLARMDGEGITSYSPAMTEWMCRPEFSRTYQPIYIRRSRNIAKGDGTYKSLEESYNRLISMGLVDRDETISINWMKSSDTNPRSAGTCSVLMRCLSINNNLDNESVPDIALDLALYHQLCVINAGFNLTGDGFSDKVREIEDRFPNKKDAVNELDKLFITI
jgi:hypothetical protein